MNYTNGNYHAFISAIKPKDSENKSAYLVGSGLASLAAAVFLIRDGQLKGENIHILEELSLPGGSLDAANRKGEGFVMRGGREMEEHFEILWDLFRTIPSIEDPNVSVLDEFYRLNLEDPSFSYTRVIENKGQRLATDGQLTLTEKAIKEMFALVLKEEDELNDVKINEVFSEDFFVSNFWLYWSTMFAFEKGASAMEMRRYLLRFIHHIASLADMSALRFTRYNQYESLVLPLISYLKDHGVTFEYDTVVKNIVVAEENGKKIATQLIKEVAGKEDTVDLTLDDLIFVTNGSITESSTYGDSNTPPELKHEIGAAWTLWYNLVEQFPEFGNPSVFCQNIPEENWVISGTITLKDDRVLPYIEKISKKNPHSGSIVTSGPVTIKDSNWGYGYSISRQPVFRAQKENETIVWVYGLLSNTEGNYIKKKITQCTGNELCEEWLYHIGVPEEDISDIALNGASTVPVYMPYITSYFMPRKIGDRPLVVPEGSQNLAFIGNFAETERDCVFTTEYAVRTAMEAVYTFLGITRGVPEVFDSSFDIRVLLRTVYYLNDKKSLSEIKLPLIEKQIEKHTLKKIKGTYLEELLQKSKLL